MIEPLLRLDTMPTLRTGRPTLRELTAADAAALLEVFSDPEAMRYWSSAAPRGGRDAPPGSPPGSDPL